MAVPMELTIDLQPMPVDAHAGLLMEGLRGLWDQRELCDVELIAGGQRFLAHRPVLAAVSLSFHECLMQLSSAQDGGAASDHKMKLVLKLDDITHPEAVQAMLECIYGIPAIKAYSPASEGANKDVLRLAQRFQIAQLQYQACRWLTSNLSTKNVLQRLVACEEFALADVRDKILEQFIANPNALFALANDPEIVQVPAVLQDLLVRVLKLLGCDGPAAAGGPPKVAVAATAPKGKAAKKS